VIIDLQPVVQAELAARRAWLDVYPGEKMHMLRWVLR
jgi:hypothetical protein